MNFDELYDEIMSFLPESQIEKDNEGQIIIYTNLFIEDDWLALSTLEDTIADILPEASIDADFDGQSIIYTNLTVDDQDNVTTFFAI